MSSPFLDIAIGALHGSKANRQERIATEERKRRQQREDMAMRMQLAELAADPNFDISSAGQFPFLDAATGGAAASPGPAGPGAAAPSPAPLPPRPPRGPMLDEPLPEDVPPVAGGGPGAGAGASLPAIAPPGPGAAAPPIGGGAPRGPTGAPPTPFLDAGLDLGQVEVGGKQYGVTAHPGRKRQRAETNNRAAYEALHEADAEAYPHFIENMPEGYYSKELSDYAQGVRAGRIEDKRAARLGRTDAARRAAERRQDAARDEAFRLFQQGKSFEEVVASLATDHELRGVLTRTEIRREQQSAGSINAPDREKAQRMATLKVQLGKPPTPSAGGSGIDAEMQRDVIEALADGHTAEEVLDALGDSPAAPAVRRWLRRGRQLARPATP